MAGKPKLKAMAGFLAVLGSDETYQPVGQTTLHPIHDDGTAVWASGAILDGNGGVVATVNLNGVPIADWPQAKAVGAPKKEEKHLQVLLAWALHMGRLGNKGRADEAVAKIFNYSEPRKIRGLRNAQERSLGVDLDGAVILTSASAIEAALLLDKLVCMDDEGGGVTVYGIGRMWSDGPKIPFFSDLSSFRLDVPAADAEKIRSVQSKGGPVIISIIRPGQ